MYHPEGLSASLSEQLARRDEAPVVVHENSRFSSKPRSVPTKSEEAVAANYADVYRTLGYKEPGGGATVRRLSIRFLAPPR